MNRILRSGKHSGIVVSKRPVPVLFSTTAASPPPKSKGSLSIPAAFALAAGSLLGGYCLGSSNTNHLSEINKNRELPKGERGCCSCDAEPAPKRELTEAQSELPDKLAKIVGKQHVYDGLEQTSKNVQFLKGARLGEGHAVAIVQPGTLEEAVKCLQAILDAGCVVQPQGSNTGLTGG